MRSGSSRTQTPASEASKGAPLPYSVALRGACTPRATLFGHRPQYSEKRAKKDFKSEIFDSEVLRAACTPRAIPKLRRTRGRAAFRTSVGRGAQVISAGGAQSLAAPDATGATAPVAHLPEDRKDAGEPDDEPQRQRDVDVQPARPVRAGPRRNGAEAGHAQPHRRLRVHGGGERVVRPRVGPRRGEFVVEAVAARRDLERRVPIEVLDRAALHAQPARAADQRPLARDDELAVVGELHRPPRPAVADVALAAE